MTLHPYAAFDALIELAAPRQCCGCGSRGARWCVGCAARLERIVAADGIGWLERPAVELPPTWVHADYDGVVRGAIPAYKDGRGDLRDPLVLLLRAGLAGLLRADAGLRDAVTAGDLLVVTAPSRPESVRARGFVPVRDLVRSGFPAAVGRQAPARTLRFARVVEDQGGLAAGRRAENLRGALRANGVRGRPCLLVDDVVTTGATLAEGARALLAAGAESVTALAIAGTSLRVNRAPPFVYSPDTGD